MTYDCVLDDPPVETILVIQGGVTVIPHTFQGGITITEAGPADYLLSFTEAAGPSGSVQEVTCVLDDSCAEDIDGWQLAVCHDADLLSVVSVENGETTLTVQNGAPPALAFVGILPGDLPHNKIDR